jgi:hypothetical protein
MYVRLGVHEEYAKQEQVRALALLCFTVVVTFRDEMVADGHSCAC